MVKAELVFSVGKEETGGHAVLHTFLLWGSHWQLGNLKLYLTPSSANNHFIQ